MKFEERMVNCDTLSISPISARYFKMLNQLVSRSTVPETLHSSPSIHHSSFIIHHSSFIIHHS
ncbi:MAG: hypothetical protein OXU26_03070, partial [Acidobacteriota bacterium]|nr:hypothetical protein [Acidobacteriota bacterium]